MAKLKNVLKRAVGAAKGAVKKITGAGSRKPRPKYDETTSADYVRKEYLVRRLNERIASIVRHAGVGNEEVTRWQAKLTRPNSPYISKTSEYDPAKMKSAKNIRYGEKAKYQTLSRKRADIEKMSYDALLRLEEQTRGWGEVKAEARRDIEQQLRAEQEYNPFIPANQLPGIADQITEDQIIEYINQKETIREFIEGNSEAFYALIEATGWDDIRQHTTSEIYNQVRRLDMNTYKFTDTLGRIGEDYIKRRDAARERRRLLGV